MKENWKIRKAERKDLSALLDIYNYEVEKGVATFDLNPKGMEEWEAWFACHNVANHPLLVLEECGAVMGYASLSPYREKEAYAATVELSIYISPQHRGKGAAQALMEEILKLAREDETIHTVVSVITSGNAASIRLHEKFGFAFSGTIREVGWKMGRYLDIDNFYLIV